MKSAAAHVLAGCRWISFSLAVMLGGGAALGDVPLAVRNTGPVSNLFGLPRALGAGLVGSGWEHTLSIDLASNFTGATRGGSQGFFDGETLVTTYRVRTRVGTMFEVGMELPHVGHFGGFLDAPIDGFHELFGFDDGDRPLAPRNRLDYAVVVDGVTYANFQDSRGHVGDVRAWSGWQVFDADVDRLAVRLMVKAPTGRVENLSGSEGWDVGAWLEYERGSWFGAAPLTMSIGGGLVVLGDGELAPADQERLAGVVHFGLRYRLGERISLKAQLDGHSRLLETGIEQIGSEALQGSLGGSIRLDERLRLDLGILEDLYSSSVSDVVFQIAITGRL